MSRKPAPNEEAAELIAFVTSVPGLIAVGVIVLAIVVSFIAGLF